MRELCEHFHQQIEINKLNIRETNQFQTYWDKSIERDKWEWNKGLKTTNKPDRRLKTWKTPKQACPTETKPCRNIGAVKWEHPPPYLQEWMNSKSSEPKTLASLALCCVSVCKCSPQTRRHLCKYVVVEHTLQPRFCTKWLRPGHTN